MYSEELIKYIPPEFDLAKYEKASELNLWDWSCNFAKRCGLRYEIYDEELTLENIKHGVFVTSVPTDRLGNSDIFSVVREVTCYQVMAISEKLDEQIGASKIYSNIQKNDPFHRKEDDELSMYVSDSEANFDWLMLEPSWLEVDMACSDKEIKAAFDAWLKSKRDITKKNQKRKRREYKLNEFSESTLARWFEARVLAYLDIEAWNYLNENKVTSKIYGDILFPEYRNKRDNTGYVNDTVKPLANLLTSQDVIMRMRKVYMQLNRQKIS